MMVSVVTAPGETPVDDVPAPMVGRRMFWSKSVPAESAVPQTGKNTQ